MRSSDWSSNVCSSDLIARLKDKLKLANTQARAATRTLREVAPTASIAAARKAKLAQQEKPGLQEPLRPLAAIETLPRSFADAVADFPELAALAHAAPNRATAPSDRLTSARQGAHDAAIDRHSGVYGKGVAVRGLFGGGVS